VKLFSVALLAVSALVLSTGAFAQGKPRTVDDCERIGEPLAYNACLASFGPKRGERAASGSDEAGPRAGRRGRTRSRASSARPAIGIPEAIDFGRTRGGKTFATFEVGGKPGPAQRRSRPR